MLHPINWFRSAAQWIAILTSAILLFAGNGIFSAHASSVVMGESLGALCYQEAKQGRSGRAAMATCNDALQNGLLNRTDLAATYVNRGIIRSTNGDLTGALVDYDHALKINPNLAEAFANRGTAFMRQTKYSQALDQLDHALTLDLEQPAAVYFNRALVHEYFGNTRKAYQDYMKAAQLRPNWQRPQKELARFVVKTH